MSTTEHDTIWEQRERDALERLEAQTRTPTRRQRAWNALKSPVGILAIGALTLVAISMVVTEVNAEHQATRTTACAAAQHDLAALRATADREADRQQFVQAAQGMINATGKVPGADFDTFYRQWDATYHAQRVEDDYQRVLLERVTANVKVCAP